ncbi:putative YTH domain family protein [Naja naja]|nr:putative YTH domain family protein [Naja naja]
MIPAFPDFGRLQGKEVVLSSNYEVNLAISTSFYHLHQPLLN